MMGLVRSVMTKVLGREPPPPPIDPLSLADDAALDAPLAAAGLRLEADRGWAAALPPGQRRRPELAARHAPGACEAEGARGRGRRERHGARARKLFRGGGAVARGSGWRNRHAECHLPPDRG